VPTDTRSRMLVAGAELFRDRGFDGTGLREIVNRAGAAQGAIYHHFPHGKLQLATEVVDLTGGRIAEIVEAECAAHPPPEAVRRLIGIAERIMFEPDLRPPVRSTTSVARTFDRWQAAIADCLVRAGLAPEDAQRFATLAIASVEGSLLLCRAQESPQPLRDVGLALQEHLKGILPSSATSVRLIQG
jgi:TetR/AcrR family transcriptional regulator, lmrAB and yxaGH operons repressor